MSTSTIISQRQHQQVFQPQLQQLHKQQQHQSSELSQPHLKSQPKAMTSSTTGYYPYQYLIAAMDYHPHDSVSTSATSSQGTSTYQHHQHCYQQY